MFVFFYFSVSRKARKTRNTVKALLSHQGAYLIPGHINGGLNREGGGGGLISNHRLNVKIVFVKNSNNCSDALNGMATVLHI